MMIAAPDLPVAGEGGQFQHWRRVGVVCREHLATCHQPNTKTSADSTSDTCAANDYWKEKVNIDTKLHLILI